MSGHRYHFTRGWVVEAARSDVYDALHAMEAWPRWWSHLREVGPLDDEGFRRFVMRAPVGYLLAVEGRIVESTRPERITAELDGDLTGSGVMRLRDVSDGTRIDYEIDVATTKAWMNAAAPALRPLLVRSHDRVVREAFVGLGRLLDAPVRPL
jgi:uncharacterized membrane protein